jgi:hypothetical protein
MSCEFCAAPMAPPPRPSSGPVPAAAGGMMPQYASRSASMEMPGVVSVMRVLLVLGIVLMSLVLVLFVLALSGAFGRPPSGSDPTTVMIALPVIVVFIGLYGWLFKALGEGSSAAWWVVQVLQIANLLNVPCGTVIGGLILYFWNQPDTKDWFGV